MTVAITLRTDRLLLQPLQPADLPSLVTLYGDARVMHYITGRARTPEETAQRLDAHLQQHATYGFGLYATLERATGSFIGRCGLEPRPEQPRAGSTVPALAGDLAWMFAVSHWGKGLGLEVGRALVDYGLYQLQLARVFATAAHGNTASIAIMKHLDMQLVADTERGVEYEIRRE